MLSLAASLLLLSAQGLSVGKAAVDITPDVPLPLGGYTERGTKLSIPGGDHLYARTLAFETDRTRIAVVSVETLTIPESLVREVKKRIPKDIDLFLAATHTHSAPDSQMINDRMTFAIPGIASFKKKWLDWYADRIAKSVKDAFDQSSECDALLIKEAHSDFNVGRRKFADPDKTVTEVFGTFIAEGPPKEAPAGGVAISAVETFPVDQPLVVQYAAHGTVYGAKELHTRGDWPGVAAQKFDSLILQGAIGDVLPAQWGPTDPQSIQKIVKGLSDALNGAHKTRVWKDGQPISFVSVPIPLSPATPHPTMAKSYGVPESFAQGIVKQFAPPTASIAAFRIGKLAVVGVPGEPTSILGKQIRDAGRRIGFESVLVCSHVNGWMGYILDPEDYDRGGYEGTLSFYGREEGTKVVDAGIKALKELASGKR